MKTIYLSKLFLFNFFLLICNTAFGITIGISYPEISDNVKDRNFINEIDNSFIFMLSDIQYINLVRVQSLMSDIKKNNKSIYMNDEFKDIDYCITWNIKKYIKKTNPNFYDYEILENSVLLEGEIIIINIKTGIVGRTEKIFFNNVSRDDHKDIEEEILRELKLHFNILLREFDKIQSDIEVIKSNLFFATLNSGILSGVSGGAYLRSSDGGLLRVIHSLPDSSNAIVLISSKSDESGYYKIPKTGFDFRFEAGIVFLSPINNDKAVLTGFNVSLLFSIPVVSFFRPYVDISFLVTIINSEILVPLFVTTGVEGYFDINRVTFYNRLGIGAVFSPDASKSLDSDSFMFIINGGMQLRLTADISLFLNGGYRFLINEKFAINWGYSLSSPLISAGFVILL